jgi:hypothetical protein
MPRFRGPHRARAMGPLAGHDTLLLGTFVAQRCDGLLQKINLSTRPLPDAPDLSCP